MKKYSLIIIALLFGYQILFSQTQIGNSILGTDLFKRAGRSVALSADGTLLAIGAHESNTQSSGIVRVYQRIESNWFQVGNDITGTSNGDNFGCSLSLSSDGSIIAIGAHGSGSNGYVRVYQNATNSNQWVQLGNDIVSTTDFNYFGSSVSLSSNGSVLAISAERDSSSGFINRGKVKVFKNINSSWLQIGNDLNGEATSDYFGTSISLSSDGILLAVGAPGNDYNGTDSGTVTIYQYSNGNWITFGNTIGGEATGDISGQSVSLSADGTTIAIGAPNNDNANGSNAGQVRVYKKIGATWTIIGTEINGETQNIKLGYDVSLSASGEILAIGTPFGANSAGRVKFYINNSNFWIPLGNAIDGDEMGDFSSDALCIAADGSTVSIGSTNHGSYFGQVKVFDLSQLLSLSNNTLFGFTIYPNPTKNSFSINSKIPIKIVTLYDLLGKKIKMFDAYQTTFDISEFNAGIYLLEIQTNQGKTASLIIKE